MEPVRRASLWLLLAVVATLLPSAAAQRYRPAVCDITCCRTNPSCTNATSVICDCPYERQMTLGSSVFPSTIQNITINRAQNIIIGPDVTEHLYQLKRLDIKHVNYLKIKQHGLRLQRNSRFRAFRVFRVNTVTIEDSAFSGPWNGDALVLMESISVVSVYQKAFDYYSSSLGPSLTYYDVRHLDLASGAIVAPISRLSIMHVHMSICRQHSFTGNVNRLLLDHVSISDAKSGCVRTDGDGMEQLSIHSCFFGNVQNRAFSGKINDVLISSTTMTSIQENGFQIQVDRLHVNRTSIDELNANGLNVTAKNAFLFSNVRVRSLRRHALLGLKVDKSSTGNPPSIIIRSLYIDHPPADSSLAFADCTPVHIEDLQVVRPWPQVCPTEQWTRRLVGASETARLTMPQYQVYQQLVRGNPCIGDSYQPLTDGDVADQDCTDGSSAPHRGGGETHEAGGFNRPDTDHTAGGTDRPDTGYTAGGTNRHDKDHREGGSERGDNPHGFSGAARRPSPSEPADAPEGTRSTGNSGGGGATPSRPGQADTSGRVLVTSEDQHPALYFALGLGAALVLVTAGCLLVRWRRARVARLTCPPHDAAPKTHSVELLQQGCGTGDWPSQARSEHTETTATRDTATATRDTATMTRDTAHCPPPETCDFAELPPAAPADGDYAGIPGSADYADPVSVTGGGATKSDDYAEILPLDCVSDRSVDSHAALTPSKQRAAPPAAAPSAPRRVGYAEVCPSARVAPPVGRGPAYGRESAESVPPPLLPVNAERLQMADGMLENVLYAPAQELWMCSGKEVQTTPGRD